MSKKGQSRRANCPISNESKKTQDTTSVLPGPILSHAAQYGVKTKPDKSPLFLAAFLAALLLLSPSPGQAVEAEVAISNIDRGFRNTERRSGPLAQVFTTGSRNGGYGVYSVEIAYEDEQGDEFSAAIYAVDSDGFPTDEVVALETSDDFSSSGKIVFTPGEGAGDLLTENTSYAVRVEGDDDRDVDYVATYRGARLDCPLPPPCTTPGGCPAPPTTCNNDTENSKGEKLWKGWKIKPQLAIKLSGAWGELTYNRPNGDRLNVAMPIRIKTLKVPNPPRYIGVLSEIATVRLTWVSPTTSGARPVTGYRYRHRLNVDPPDWSEWIEQDSQSVTITGLTTGSRYVFQVQAGNDGGWSKAVKVITTITEPLGAPTLTATANANGSIDLTWTDDAPPPKGYYVRWKRNTHGWDGNPGGDEQMNFCSVDSPSKYTITGGIGNVDAGDFCSGTGRVLKTDGTEYGIEVRTAVVKGYPDSYLIYGPPATASATPFRTASGAPGNVVAEAGEKHVTLRWATPSIVGSYSITDYEYRYKESAGDLWSEWRGTAPTTEFCSECSTWIGRVNYWQRNGSARRT